MSEQMTIYATKFCVGGEVPPKTEAVCYRGFVVDRHGNKILAGWPSRTVAKQMVKTQEAVVGGYDPALKMLRWTFERSMFKHTTLSKKIVKDKKTRRHTGESKTPDGRMLISQMKHLASKSKGN